ncbi:MAG TPA: hypothetical protein PKY63_12340 [Bacteroidales bacterium]|nr:hypothetical protein [Bacteroidales bacterium]
MKHIILLLFVFFCLFSSLLAQNPYVEQSFPWLNLQVVKDQKIKSIMLATVSAENASVVNQVLLSFDPSGRLVKEETQSGFRHSCEMYYDHHGLLKKVISQYGTSQDSVVYSYDKQNNAFVSQFLSREESGTWSVTETRYVYSGENKLLEIQTSEGSVKVLQPAGKNNLALVSTEKITHTGFEIFSSVGDISKTYVYDASGHLLSYSFTNALYGMTEESVYSYDQHDRLVMITWSQEGLTSKTFVTYEFYE